MTEILSWSLKPRFQKASLFLRAVAVAEFVFVVVASSYFLRQVSDLFEHGRHHVFQPLGHLASVADIQKTTSPRARSRHAACAQRDQEESCLSLGDRLLDQLATTSRDLHFFFEPSNPLHSRLLATQACYASPCGTTRSFFRRFLATRCRLSALRRRLALFRQLRVSNISVKNFSHESRSSLQPSRSASSQARRRQGR
jgi:hypothetical protein